jgi:hypothetical protein
MGRLKKIQKALDFIEYMSKPMEKSDLMLMYRINNVTPERTKLYLDFIYGLFDLVTTTYLGDDCMEKEDIKNHFNWCWSKNLESFKKEKIYFLNSDELFSYFELLFMESFYKEGDKSDENVNKLIEFWCSTFDYSENKTMSELETFIELYKIFDSTLYV